MAVLLGILARIGRILLIILLVLLVLVACLLFTPFWYSGFFRKKGSDIRLKAGVRWLFSFLYARVLYDGDDGMDPEVYIIGIPVLRLVRFFKKNQKEKKPREKKKNPKPEKKKSRLSKIKEIWKLLQSDEFQEAKKVVTEEGMKIIRHIRPDIKGSVEFGLDDPASTGMLLGVLGAVYPVLPEGLSIVPDFTEQKLEADVRFSGRFFLIALLVYGIRILKSPAVRKLIRRMRARSA